VARFARVVGCSWRAHETYILIGRWYYLHRAVDKQGRTVDFVLREDRGIEVAQAFFRGPLTSQPDRPPRKVTLDGHVPSHRAIKRRCAPMKGIKSFAGRGHHDRGNRTGASDSQEAIFIGPRSSTRRAVAANRLATSACLMRQDREVLVRSEKPVMHRNRGARRSMFAPLMSWPGRSRRPDAP